MTLVFDTNDCCLLDHGRYVTNLYKKVVDDEQVTSFELSEKLFHIVNRNNSRDIHRKRKHKSNEYHEETLNIKMQYETFLNEIPISIKEVLCKENLTIDSSEVLKLSQLLCEGTIFEHIGLNGGNNLGSPLKCKVRNEYFLIPQNCRFFCGCIKEQCPKLDGNKFDILVADPPWWNKYIRRLKNANDKLSYNMMYNKDIASIPVKNLLASDCIIAVWCTNAQSNIDAVKNLIFPKWGVEYVTTWYWLKVTIDLKPLCPFSAGCKKQPYERIILGRVGKIKDIPMEKIILSVPSALHSHKLPLLDLLKPYLNKENPEALELFARYLLPNTTSVGYEPLKWQHISLYEKITSDT
ncbi:N(6)-adenine-specific methyltransferase METTL4 [Ostrinia nubilalis]|uniref:N(6)-adenine-specific methyltransferase METTL4 n=1 Tax=Ostrinia nubilalis TaxID=29057 RepID=UPI0030825D67